VCSIFAIAIWSGTVASAAEDPVPPPTTTTSTTVDAPPPDPYSPPAQGTRKPKPKPAARRVAPASPVQTYTPPAPARPRPAVQTSSAAPQRRTKVARKQKQRRRPVKRVSKPAPVRVDFAPLDGLIASARLPVVAERDADEPYLWLAGLSFAVLGVAGTGVLMLTFRSFREGWE
jgi:hypothetical protein